MYYFVSEAGVDSV